MYANVMAIGQGNQTRTIVYTPQDMDRWYMDNDFFSRLHSLNVVRLRTSISLNNFKMVHGNEEMKKNDAMEYCR